MEAPSSCTTDDGLSQPEGLPEGLTQPCADLDSFSDSFTNITPSSNEPAASVLDTETLGRVDVTQEEETFLQGEAYHVNTEGLQEEELQSGQGQGTDGVGNQAGKNKKTEVGVH